MTDHYLQHWIIVVLLMWKWMDQSLMNIHVLKILFVCIDETALKNVGALIHCMKFLSTEVTLYFYKSTTQLCSECWFHTWAGALSCHFYMLDKLQKWVSRTIGPTSVASVESLADEQNVTSVSLLWVFERCSSELIELVQIHFSWWRFMHFSNRFHDFCVDIVAFIRMFMSTFFSPCSGNTYRVSDCWRIPPHLPKSL